MLKSPTAQIVLTTCALLFVAAVVALPLADRAPEKSEKNITLVYVGADDCAPCRIWQRNQGKAFRDSSEYVRLVYREVKSPILFDVMKDDNWPTELRVYRQAIGRGTGVPLWFVIADDQIVMQRFGLSQWQETVLPKIKSLLR